MRPVVLASTSPRRRELLQRLGIPFEVAAPTFEEDMTLPMAPTDLARHIALGKARSVAGEWRNSIVIAADTFLVHDGRVLGKPADADDAKRMLVSLQGRDHQVVTGLAVLEAGVVRTTDVSQSHVRMRPMTMSEIDRYVATGEPLDKAGAYALQGTGAMFITKIEGDMTSVIGLPLATVAEALGRLGYSLPAAN